MKLAIDVESVLAEPNEAVLNATDRLSRKEVTETWFSNGPQSTGYQIYMGVSDAIWRHKPELIAPEEPSLDTYIKELREDHYILILTHRQHVDEQVEWWLAEHGIEYDEYISTDLPKWEFDADVYVDDNPNMVGNCPLLLRHQKWNAHLDCGDCSQCRRIHSLADVKEKVETFK